MEVLFYVRELLLFEQFSFPRHGGEADSDCENDLNSQNNLRNRYKNGRDWGWLHN